MPSIVSYYDRILEVVKTVTPEWFWYPLENNPNSGWEIFEAYAKVFDRCMMAYQNMFLLNARLSEIPSTISHNGQTCIIPPVTCISFTLTRGTSGPAYQYNKGSRVRLHGTSLIAITNVDASWAEGETGDRPGILAFATVPTYKWNLEPSQPGVQNVFDLLDLEVGQDVVVSDYDIVILGADRIAYLHGLNYGVYPYPFESPRSFADRIRNMSKGVSVEELELLVDRMLAPYTDLRCQILDQGDESLYLDDTGDHGFLDDTEDSPYLEFLTRMVNYFTLVLPEIGEQQQYGTMFDDDSEYGFYDDIEEYFLDGDDWSRDDAYLSIMEMVTKRKAAGVQYLVVIQQ